MSQRIAINPLGGRISEHGIDFVCFLNKHGRVIDYMCKNEINLSKDQKEMFFMETSLNLSMQSDFDESLGTVQYTVTERANSKIVSIPANFGCIMLGVNKKARTTLSVRKLLKAIDYLKGLDDKSEPEKSPIMKEIKEWL